MYVCVHTYVMPWPHFISAIAYANCSNILFSITLLFNLAIIYSKSVIAFEYTYVHIIHISKAYTHTLATGDTYICIRMYVYDA